MSHDANPPSQETIRPYISPELSLQSEKMSSFSDRFPDIEVLLQDVTYESIYRGCSDVHSRALYLTWRTSIERSRCVKVEVRQPLYRAIERPWYEEAEQ